MRVTIIQAQPERKRQDRCVPCTEKRRHQATMRPLRGLIPPNPTVSATTDAARGGKSLSSGQIQGTLPSDAKPLGESRLVYFSELFLFAADWATRALVSLSTGASVTMALAWFNPKMFFARLTLALLVPIFLSSLFGVEISLDANGDRFGGLVNFGADTDPVATIVVGLLCALAMIFHGRRS